MSAHCRHGLGLDSAVKFDQVLSEWRQGRSSAGGTTLPFGDRGAKAVPSYHPTIPMSVCIMPSSQQAAEIDPVLSMASNSLTFPGPRARPSPRSILNVSLGRFHAQSHRHASRRTAAVARRKAIACNVRDRKSNPILEIDLRAGMYWCLRSAPHLRQRGRRTSAQLVVAPVPRSPRSWKALCR